MASSLASQLGGIRSLNAARLASASSLSSHSSYLFPPATASKQDLDSIFSLGQSGWTDLCLHDAALEKSLAAQRLFSPSSKTTDRTMLSKEDNASIDAAVQDFFDRVGAVLLGKSAAKCIEWLVRRFRIHDFNAVVVLRAFLPFHSTPQFARMLNILSISKESHLAFLLPIQKAAQPLPTSVLLSALLAPASSSHSLDALRLVGGVLPTDKEPHRAQVLFWSSTLVQFCARSAGAEAGNDGLVGLNRKKARTSSQSREDNDQLVLGLLLPTIANVITSKAMGTEAQLAGCLVLCSVGASFDLSVEAIQSTIATIVPAVAEPKADTRLIQAVVTTLATLCASSDDLQPLPLATVQQLFNVPNFTQQVQAMSRQYDLRAFVGTLLPTMAKSLDDEQMSGGLVALLATPSSEGGVPTSDAVEALRIIATSQSSASGSVLSDIRSRRSDAFDALVRNLSQSQDTRHLVASVLQGAFSGSHAGTANSTSWLAINSSEASQRLASLDALLDSIAAEEIDAKDSFVRDALSSRLLDEDEGVLAVLYSTKGTAALKQSLDEATMLSKLEAVLSATSKLPRKALQAHLGFVLTNVLTPKTATRILRNILWPRLLLTKTNRKATEATHEALQKTSRHSLQPLQALLAGIVVQRDEERTTTQINRAAAQGLASAMAGVESESHFNAHVSFLIGQATSRDGTEASIALALATIIELLPLVDAQRFQPLAQRLLDALPLASLDGGEQGVLASDTGISDELWQRVYEQAPRSSRLLASQTILAVAQCLHFPTSSLVGLDGVDATSPMVALAERLYGSACSSPAGRELFVVLFKKLGPSTPTFLARVWTCASMATSIRATALRHCHAFLAAHRARGGMDFQLLVPALITPLSSVEPALRSEALNCLDFIAESAAGESDSTTIWGYDAVYGEASEKLRYLDTSALHRLVSDLLEEREAIVNDASYLGVLLPTLLTPQKGQEKRKVNQQRSATSYLLSHAVAWPSFSAKLLLLRALSGLRDSAKLTPLLPLLDDVVAAGQKQPSLDTFFAGQLEVDERDEFARLLFEAVDKRAKTTIEDAESGAWTMLAKALSSPANLVSKHAALALKTVFPVIAPARRREAVERLTAALVDPKVQAPKELRATLGQLDIDVDILVSILASLRLAITERSLGSPAAKKSRSDAPRDDEASSTANLSELLEALLQRRLAISPALIVELFEVLRTATELHTTGHASGDYLLHLTLSNLYNVLQGATPTSDVVASLRVDTVVNVIKASSNPSTFQQALLLLSAIAALAPETVLHSAMPIFTFVGSSVLQRDDAFSFAVVERVLRSIVPPLVKSLRAQSGKDGGFALLKLARPFLCIFTDSATHIPRHRRANFFQLLVETLGPVDFTSAIAMLLVDRSAHKIVRQQGPSSQSLQLPLSILVSQSASTQLKSFVSIYTEIERLLATRDADPTQAEQQVFLDRLSRVSSEHSDKQIDAAVQAQALLALLQAAIDSPQFGLKASRAASDEASRALYQQIVEASLRVGAFEDEDVGRAANAVLSSIMALVPVETFASIVTRLTGDATNADLRDSGYDLIAARLPSLSAGEREYFASSTAKIVESARKVLAGGVESLAVLSSLQAIAATCLPAEHTALSSLVPQLLALIESADASVAAQKAAFSIIRSLSAVLGPRLLSHLKRIVDAGIITSKKPASSSLRTLALETLTKLFTSVSSFMETHIQPIIAVSTEPELQAILNDDTSRGAGRAANALLSTLIKVSPSDKVFSATFAVWDGAELTHTFIGTLDFLQRALRLADRSAVASNYKAIFRFILRVLDQRRTTASSDPARTIAVENAAVRVFTRLVLKLNETTFRPLFLRIYDWAALDLAEDDMPLSDSGLVARRIALFKVSNALHEQLRGLISHYYATMLDLVIELLEGYRTSKLDDAELWSAVLTSIDKSARYDEGTFWNPKRLEKLSPAFVGQLSMRNASLVEKVGGAEAIRDAVSPAVVSLARCVPDEGSLKVLNSSLLTPLRIDDVAVRSSTLNVLTALWSESSLSSVLLGLVPETVPHIAELMESDELEVVAATREFIAAVEGVLGEPLDAYLQ
ncbi:hypothetical protein BDZ90DRAFT_234655 [Jaminaea rosea]|uniref:U3 small nucleolar RNA-associated protein 10 n=1 Tax=Jaminaea rosea TaxID=1569628 RepID=A0A316UHE8_9BASI|nr:hypothetical protein BDZ90DRAFT_234655 [Jaminaea rosea]PWN24696.1 hypothetical protein BDZ90DRAFT_234655 [Jaminaea rosea]